MQEERPLDRLGFNKNIFLSEALIAQFMVFSFKIHNHFILLNQKGNHLLNRLKVAAYSWEFGAFVEVAAVDGLVVCFDSRVVGTVVEDFDVFHVPVDDGFVELSHFLAHGQEVLVAVVFDDFEFFAVPDKKPNY